MGWVWDGYGMGMGWVWDGYGMGMGWVWVWVWMWELRPRSDGALVRALSLFEGRIAPRAALPQGGAPTWVKPALCLGCALA